MKILVIEDDQPFADGLLALLSDVQGVSAEMHSDAESAATAIAEEMFDLIILDLKLPSAKGALDAKAENGHALFELILRSAPGTPVRILTSSEPDKFLRRLAGKGEQTDIWGGGNKVPTVEYYVKDEANDLIEDIRLHARVISETDRIPINTRGIDLALNRPQQRAIRSFVRKTGGSSCDARRLGGLSGAVVLKVVVADERGHRVAAAVGKIGLQEKVSKEMVAYDRHVKNLKIGAFAHVVSHQDQGLHNTSSVFYQLADDFDSTFFELISARPQEAAKVISRLRAALDVWSSTREQRICTVKDVRRSILDDKAFEKITAEFELEDLRGIEELQISIASSCLHGDLHGANVLVDSALHPVIIDYGDVARGFTCLDPVTLELSMIFHPDANQLKAELEEGISNWPDRQAYAAESKVKPVIEACRDWAYDVAGGDAAFLVAAYCFAFRQLKFDTVKPTTTISLIRSLAQRIEALR